MKVIYVVCFRRRDNGRIVVDSVFKNREDAQDYVDQWNEWEKSEDGNDDLWFLNDVEYHETRVEI